MLGEAVAEAQLFGTTVIMPAKMVTEPTSAPPQYISYPVKQIMDANPELGLIMIRWTLMVFLVDTHFLMLWHMNQINII